MSQRVINVVRTGFPDRDGFDTAVAQAMLQRASAGQLGETFRIHVPGRVVAFGKHDTLVPGYRDAVAAARHNGFLPVLRLAGGRAAVFHENTLAFSWSIPDEDPPRGIRHRFDMISGLLVRAFKRLGIESRVGEIPGEYCPGEFSINLDGRLKVVGVGQRLGRRAAHIGGVVVVADAELIRTALGPVYRALEVSWRPETAGAIDHADPSIGVAAVSTAIIAELDALAPTIDAAIDAPTLELAESLVADRLQDAQAGRPL